MASVEQFVKAIGRAAKKADEQEAPPPRRRMRTVIDRCGWEKRSPQRMSDLNDALEAAGVFASPQPAMSVDLDDWVRFTTSPSRDPELGLVFLKEKTLEDFVARYYQKLFEGWPGLEGAKLMKAQHPVYVAGKKRIIDLLFMGADGAQIVVELKKGDPTMGALAQLRQYMDQVRPDEGPVRGVLISAPPRDAALARAMWSDLDSDRRDYDVTWLWYDLKVDLVMADRDT